MGEGLWDAIHPSDIIGTPSADRCINQTFLPSKLVGQVVQQTLQQLANMKAADPRVGLKNQSLAA